MMLFGQQKDKKPDAAIADNAGVFDVTTESFERDVIMASMETPILVDFWAPWCGPCKQLGPVLEAAIAATKGAVRMAKINIDDNQDLAQALRVQSIPTVYAFFQGKPVTAFTGNRPASEIKSLIDQLTKLARQGRPDALDIPKALTDAAAKMTAGDMMGAQEIYAQILAQDEMNAAAYAGLIRSFIALGDVEQAQFMVEDAPEPIRGKHDFAAAKTALEMAQAMPQAGSNIKALEARLDKNPADHAARFDLALARFSAGEKAAAIDGLITIMMHEKTSGQKWEDDKARQQIFKFFDALGPADPETAAGRRRLSAFLFS